MLPYTPRSSNPMADDFDLLIKQYISAKCIYANIRPQLKYMKVIMYCPGKARSEIPFGLTCFGGGWRCITK